MSLLILYWLDKHNFIEKSQKLNYHFDKVHTAKV